MTKETTTMRTTTHRSMTIDEAAVHTMLNGTKDDMQRLRHDVAIATGEQCPECPSMDIEGNGPPGRETAFRCCDCGHQWEPAECTVRVPM
jgi:transposase-like protein